MIPTSIQQIKSLKLVPFRNPRRMLSLNFSFFVAFFFWAITLEAAPAMHHHRHGNHHLRDLHASRAALLHRTRSHSHGAPQVSVEKAQEPSGSAWVQVAPDQETQDHSIERLTV
ncbi:Ff.00g097060.m01.CDS01 [Fusarium sp. VM40]|nr:Ff.00g097060.m01.CDS01 [Fusarium sp. VM40]